MCQVKPAAFAYLAPSRAEEAVALLQAHGEDARLLAGGQSLMPLLNMRLARPKVLIDLNRVPELAYIHAGNGHVALGAMTRHAAVEDSSEVQRRCPLLAEAVRHIGHRTIRNRGTIGGSIAHADPAAELPAVLCCLGGEVVLAGPAGRRVVGARDFFHGYMMTARATDELLVEVRLPVIPEGAGWAFAECSRRHGDFALVGVAAVVERQAGTDRCAGARLALTGVGGQPVTMTPAVQGLAGDRLTPELATEVAHAVMDAVEPDGDIHASAEFRRHLAGVMTRRALQLAWARTERRENHG